MSGAAGNPAGDRVSAGTEYPRETSLKMPMVLLVNPADRNQCRRSGIERAGVRGSFDANRGRRSPAAKSGTCRTMPICIQSAGPPES